MSAWREVTLGQVADLTVGFVGTMARHYEPDGVPFLRSQNVLPHHLDLADIRFISPEFNERIAKSQLRPGDVVTVRTGAPGTTAVIPESLESANCSDLVITRPGPELDARWLSYHMNSGARHSIASALVGAVQQHFNVGAAKAMRLSLPPLAEQQAIAEVLGALDDKIAANTALAHTAEQVLRAEIDSEWLRHSDRSVTLSEFVELNPKVSVPRSETAVYIDMKRLPESGWSIGGYDYREPKGGARFQNGDTLLARITPCLENRKTGFVDHLEESAVGIGSTEFIVLRARDGIAPPVSFLLATAPRFREYAVQHMVGTSGRQRVAASDLAAFEMPVPDVGWLNDFGARASALFAAVAANSTESRTLAATRDALLPQLMSGKLHVRDAEAVVSAAGA